MRIAKNRSQKLFDNRFADGPRSPVLYLNVIRESELLISHLNGNVSFSFSVDCILDCAVLKQLATFDLRFFSTASSPSPVRLFETHINSYTPNLVRPLILVFYASQHLSIFNT